MSEKNQYSVKMYLRGFHDAEIGQKIANCELGFEQENNRYFLSTTVTAESIKEAKRKGELRLNQVLSVFVIHTGITYPISGIHVSQISGRQPFLYSSFMTLETMTYLPISKEKIEEIGKLVELLDKLPSQKHSTKRVDKAINYFLRGCYLETQWRSESFLNFYKAIELISHHFKGDFSQTLINQLRDTLLKDSTEKEIQELLTPKRLIQFACGQLGIGDVCGVSKIVTLRNQFGAHARLEEVTVSPEDFNNCKILASRTILKYANYIQTTKNA